MLTKDRAVSPVGVAAYTRKELIMPATSRLVQKN